LFPWETYIPGNAYSAPRGALVDTAWNGSKIASLRVVIGSRKGGPLPLPVHPPRIPLEAIIEVTLPHPKGVNSGRFRAPDIISWKWTGVRSLRGVKGA